MRMPVIVNGQPVVAGRPLNEQEAAVITNRVNRASGFRYVVYRVYRTGNGALQWFAATGHDTLDAAERDMHSRPPRA